MLLLAGATSLPELATDVSASLAGAPDLAVGDLFGSSMANMAILALILLLYRGHVWAQVGVSQARVAAVAVALTAGALLGIASPSGITLGWLGIEPVLLVAGYVVAVRWLRGASTPGRHVDEPSGEAIVRGELGEAVSVASGPLRRAYLRFAITSLAILIFAPLLALAAEGLADQTGIAQTFVGVLLLAGVGGHAVW
jgi:cation:H+ antiporter